MSLLLAPRIPLSRVSRLGLSGFHSSALRLTAPLQTHPPLRPRAPRTHSAASTAALAAGDEHAARLSALEIPNAGLHSPKYQLHTTSMVRSTALSPDVAELEKGKGDVVGTVGVGVEGAHPRPTKLTAEDTGGEFAEHHDQPVHWGTTMNNPIYSPTELESVQVVNRKPVTVSDKLAHGVVKLLRRTFDLFTGYVAKPIPESVLKQNPIPVAELRAKGELLTDKQWLLRIILLESIAGVPGMVGGTLRHLRSLRLLRRDGGWIHTLLEEAENERMHLLTFLSISQPGILTRAMVLGAQFVFYNVFFFTYLVAPKTAHRFVGALEEEAVRTYTHCIDEVTKGLVPEWNDKPAPQIAIDYWRMPQDATLLDVIKAVRADEATHRFVNHSLANLDQARDFNPFALAEVEPEVRGSKPCFSREESAEFARQSHMKAGGIAPPETKE